MDARKQSGMAIAATFRIDRKGDSFFVPSQSDKGRFKVTPHPTKPHCNCPDHETTGKKCKHIFAVEYFMQRELFDYKEGVADPVILPAKAPRKTYGQKWSAYNAAQTNEKDKFLDLLRDLCGGISEPHRAKLGRPRLPLKDAVFAACFKIFSTVSGRRFISDLRAAHEKGYIEKLPHFNSIFNYLENPELTPILRDMITQTSLPLKSVERDFAADSSGFTTSRFTRWYDHKYNGVRAQHDWVKVHIMCGVTTNIVTAVEIHDKLAQDAPQLPALVNATAKNFKIAEVSGDKAYASFKNYDAIDSVGATPFIVFKSHHRANTGLWAKMFHYFQFRRDEFLRHYHKRSNVESTFSMIKAKFRDHVRSKTDVAMTNEVLCKIICHNICCLIQASYELGIDTTFWAEAAPAQQVASI